MTTRSALEGERKQVTVLFAGVKGSMELTEQVDAEEWHKVMDRFFAILSEGVHRFEGTINQYTGDGIMALFGAPIAHEDHAQRACYAALHLQQELRRYRLAMWKSLLIISATVLSLNACAAIPQALVGEFPPLTPEAAREGAAGTRVRWGGEIIRTEPGAEETCFFVLSHPLDAQARPEVDHTSTGRFIACKSGFYEPEEYLAGRELTVTGKLQETVTSKVGDYDYSYPRIQADVVYLWPKRPQYVYVSDPWGPWGSWYGPYWYGPYGAFPR